MDMREHSKALRLEDILAAADAPSTAPRGGSPQDPETQALADLAVQLRSELAPPEPSATFVATSRARLENRLRALRPADRKRLPSPSRARAIARRLAFAFLSLVAVLSLSTAGIAYAAQDSLPGDGLYPVKRGIEQARLALAVDTSAQVQLLTEFADRRISEAGALTNRNRGSDLTQALDEYQAEIDAIQSLAAELPVEGRDAILARIQLQLQEHIAVLEAVRNQAPAAAQPALDNAIQGSSHSQDVLQQIEAGNSPSEVAPGQLKKTQMPGDTGPHGPPSTPPGKSKH